MLTDPLIKIPDCDIILASPVDYEECVVWVEHAVGLLLVITDEMRDGRCIVEIPHFEGRLGWRIAIEDLRSLLDIAESRLLHGKPGA